ncbi:MAG: phosphatidylglycerol lysyltransferase domain-containing protein [Clostridiales bacterium]|nr:phosphatidylglycerol lysyltransferase domain-containing protein [Clostridiales bacterium]
MLVFSKPKLADKLWITNILENNKRQGCGYCFGNIFMWNNVYKTEIANYNGCLFAKSENRAEKISYAFPAGNSDIENLIEIIEKDASERQRKFIIYAIEKDDKDLIEEKMPDKFEFSLDRDNSDYVYLVEDLINLAGRKYHSKRNHISFFENNFNWKYEEIDSTNIDECFEMNKEWLRKNIENNKDGLMDESEAISLAFENFFELNFKGGLLRTDDKIVAYTMGEKLNDETFCTHIEKAYSDIRGAYPMINKCFASNTIKDYKYVNREEDMGIEGLRKAKLSYNPYSIVKKYTAVLKND